MFIVCIYTSYLDGFDYPGKSYTMLFWISLFTRYNIDNGVGEVHPDEVGAMNLSSFVVSIIILSQPSRGSSFIPKNFAREIMQLFSIGLFQLNIE